jgi:hypothetical protein
LIHELEESWGVEEVVGSVDGRGELMISVWATAAGDAEVDAVHMALVGRA